MTTPANYADLLRALAHDEAVPCQQFVTPSGIVARDSHAVLARAIERGSQLAQMGLEVGDKVAIIVSEPGEFLPLIHGCLLFGFVAVPMYPPPLFGRLDTYRETLTAILRVADVQVAVTDAGLASRLGELHSVRTLELDHLPCAAAIEPPAFDVEQLALLQFTSGSTAQPRGVQISHRALMANARAIMVDGLNASQTDHGVTWLPLYHDMGLIGFGLAPLLTKTPVTFVPTARFVRNPAIWLQTITATRGTITFAPNFAYALATKRVATSGLELASVRMWGCGAEPVSEHVLTTFERHFAACGVRPGSVAPCYGLAEATLAVTFTPPGGPRVLVRLDTESWETRGVAQSVAERRNPTGDAALAPESTSLAVVSCGSPLPGYSVRIIDDEGRAVAEGAGGEIVVDGPSLGIGYEGDIAETERVFRPSGLRTGDRGFIRDGQLFVTGRIKDTLIANGRKYDPHVLEHWAEQVSGVRRAAAVNHATDDGETLIVLVECAAEERERVAESVRAMLATRVGVAVTRVVCLAPQSLPRTTSGKIRRAAAKTLITPR